MHLKLLENVTMYKARKGIHDLHKKHLPILTLRQLAETDELAVTPFQAFPVFGAFPLS